VTLQGDRLEINNTDPSYLAAQIVQEITAGTPAQPALHVHQNGTTGEGEAIRAISINPDVPVVSVRGPGDLLDLRNNAGTSVFKVNQAGANTTPLVTPGLTVNGNGTVTGDLTVAGTVSSNGFQLPIIPPFTRRPAWRDGTVVTNFQTGHGWTIGSGSGSASHTDPYTADFVKGVQSVQVVTAANAQQSQVRRNAMTAMDLTDKAIRLVFKVADTTHLNKVSFYAGTGGLANFFQWDVHTHSTTTSQNWVQNGEWVTLTFGWSMVTTASGTFTLSATKVPSVTTGFTDMEIVVFDDGLGAVTYNVQSIEIIDATSATFPNGVCSITFDDSYQSVFDLARPKMDALGYRGSNYTIVGNLGTSSTYLTTAELQQMQNINGWEIGAHSYDPNVHTNRYTAYTAADLDLDLRKSRAWLVSNGFTGDGVAYPGGNFGFTTDGYKIEDIVARYFSYGRGITQVPEHSTPPMPYRLRTQTGINDGTSLGGITVTSMTATGGLLDRCQLQGSWLIMAFHKIVTGTPVASTEISQTGFNAMMDAINSRGIKVLPVSDVLRYYS
jgi:peptidoglycan/xylan/chitin deacetylase (PgdA/CDA1 family)